MLRTQTIARGLGLFSVGLGAVQLVAPRRFASWIGTRPDRSSERIVRLVGARELLAAVPLLTGRRPTGALWMRVMGDVMDIALLGAAARSKATRRERVYSALAGTVGIAAVDFAASAVATGNGSATASMQGGPPTVRRAITVRADRQAVYDRWRRLEDLPRFMRHLESVEITGDRRSHWRAKGPAGMSVEWDAELIEDDPGRMIAWRSLPDATVHHAGMVEFRDAPGDRGTEIHVTFEYAPPGGPIGATVAKLFGEEPSQQVGEDLAQFKQLMELGGVVVSDATLGGRKVRQRPAQPARPAELEEALV